MAHCINTNHPDYVSLEKESGLNPIILKAKISAWQEENGMDSFPTLEDTVTSLPLVKKFNSDLKASLLDFVKGLNVHVEENADELLDTLEFRQNPLSAFDTLQKFLALRTDISNKDLSLQTANIVYTFLGKKSKLAIELWKNIHQWSKYKEVYDKYAKIYESQSEDIEAEGNEFFNTFAHKQAIVHLIAEMLENNFGKNINVTDKKSNHDLTKEYFEKLGYKNKYEQQFLQKIFNKIWNWVQEYVFQNKAINEYSSQELTKRVLDIVDDVYKKDYQKFIRGIVKKNGKLYKLDGTELELKNYDETLERDLYAKLVIQKLSDNPFINYKLSGSQVVRKYGQLFRPIDEDLHDIDGVISLETFNKETNAEQVLHWIRTKGIALQRKNPKSFVKAFVPMMEKQSWYKNLKEEFPTWKLENAFIGRDHRKGESVTITGTIEHPTEIDPKTQKKKLYVLDFFLRTDEGKYPEIFDNYWKDWKQIFEAKLNMGRSKDIDDLIYFAPFIQDKYKFTNKGFRYFTFADDSGKESKPKPEKVPAIKTKRGVPELFDSNFLIFAESKTSDEVISKLLSNKIIDKKCN